MPGGEYTKFVRIIGWQKNVVEQHRKVAPLITASEALIPAHDLSLRSNFRSSNAGRMAAGPIHTVVGRIRLLKPTRCKHGLAYLLLTGC